jgi:endonuclease/exonuclease/phosphatase family metal-dependent hydrolase
MNLRASSTKFIVPLYLSLIFVFCSPFGRLHFQCMSKAVSDISAKDQPELTVMSFNIRYGKAHDGKNSWRHRKQMVFDLLRNHNPDIVGLQEALHFQINEICAELPRYSYLGVGRDDGKIKGEFCAILYLKERFDVNESDTFWLSDAPKVPGLVTWGNAFTRICTWARFIDKKNRRHFYIYNLHLDHVSQFSREKSAVLLTQHIRSRRYPDPVIITGDFNAGEDDPAILYLKGQATLADNNNLGTDNLLSMVDTFRVMHPNAPEVGTFHKFSGRRTGEKIDHILTIPGVKVLNADILYDNVDGRYPSDHFPITATMSLAAGTILRRPLYGPYDEMICNVCRLGYEFTNYFILKSMCIMF